MEGIRDDLIRELQQEGASLVGFADLSQVPAEERRQMPRAVCMAVALDRRIIADIEEGPTKAYEAEYRRVNTLLAGLGDAAAAFLRGRGFKALPNSPTTESFTADFRTPLPHKTAATRSGLGWIGKNALLITRAYGSAVRLTSVLTDAPFAADEPIDGSSCGKCTICRDVCPGKAPAGLNWELGMDRDLFFSAATCCRISDGLTGRAGLDVRSICGICICACPWTKRYLTGR